MSEVLPFDKWAESPEAQGLDEVSQLKAYGDHYRLNSFAAGQYNPEEAAAVDQHLFQTASTRGLLPEDPDEAAASWLGRGAEPDDAALRRVVEYKYARKEEGETEVRDYLAARSIEGMAPELIEKAKEKAAPFLDQKTLNAAKLGAARYGEAPFAVVDTEDGPRVEINPTAGNLTREEIAAYAKANPEAVDTRYLTLVEKLTSTPEGWRVPEHKIRLNEEIRGTVGKLSEDDDAFNRQLQRVVTAVAAGETATAKDAAQFIASRQEFRSAYAEEDVANAVLDLATRQANLDGARVLSTGEIAVGATTSLRKDTFDAALAEVDAPENQKELARKRRDDLLEVQAPRFHALASRVGGDEYLEFYEQAKAAGKTDGKIVEEWFSNDDNFSEFKEATKGVLQGTFEATVGLVMGVAALAGNDRARREMVNLQKAESARQEYVNTFGGNLGLGYDILRTAPAVATDIGLMAATGGLSSAATTGARWTARAALSQGLRTSLSEGTRALAKTAITKGTAGSVRAALLSHGDDIAKGLAQFARGTTALAPATFSRAAGGAYSSMYSQLEQIHPEWTPEQLRQAAYGHAVTQGMVTVGITSAFQGLALAAPKWFGAGVEEWAQGAGSGLTVKQLNEAYRRIALTPGRIAPEAKAFLNLETFETFVGSLTKEGMRRATLAYGKQALSEGLEEGLDQFVGAFLEANTLGEDVNIMDALKDAGHAAIIGGVFGLAGGVREVGLRSKLSDEQFQRAETDFYNQVANRLQDEGDVQSASVLRSMVARANDRQAEVGRSLQVLGRYAEAVESSVDRGAVALDKVPRTAKEMSARLRRLDEMISTLKGVGVRNLSQQSALAAATRLRERYVDLHAKALDADVNPPKGREKRTPSVLTNAKGDAIGVDRGTDARIVDEEYTSETPEEAQANIDKITEEVGRLESVSAPTAHQQARLAHLKDQRQALRDQLKQEPSTPNREAIDERLDQVERELGQLRLMAQRDPSLLDNPAYRQTVQIARARRRNLRAGIATKGGVTPSWRSYPVARILAQGAGVEAPGTVFDPATGETFTVIEDPEKALAVLKAASKRKKEQDRQTRNRMKKGEEVTQEELDSLVTEDPMEEFHDVVEKIRQWVDLHEVDPDEDLAYPKPAVAQKLRLSERLLSFFNAEEAEVDLGMVPDSVLVEDMERTDAAIVGQEGDQPLQTVSFSVQGGADVRYEAVGNVVREVKEGKAEVKETTETPQEAVAAAEAAAVEEAGGDSGLVTRFDAGLDEAAEPEQEFERSAFVDSEVDEEPSYTEDEARIAAAVIITKAEAAAKAQAASEVAAAKVEEEQAKVTLGDMASLYNVDIPRGHRIVVGTNPYLVGPGFRPSEHKLKKVGDHVVVVTQKTEKPIKRQPTIEQLFPSEHTLRGPDGTPRFLRPEDETLFWNLVNAGNKPEPRSFGNGKTYQLMSNNINYVLPFLNTVEEEINARWPQPEPPESAVKKTDPDANQQEDTKIEVRYHVALESEGYRYRYTQTELLRKRMQLEDALRGSGTYASETELRRHAKQGERRAKLNEVLDALKAAEPGRTVVIDTRGQQSAKNEARVKQFFKEHKRGARLGKSRKLSRSSNTLNIGTLFVRKKVKTSLIDDNGDPVYREQDVVFFDNNPTTVAQAISAGFPVKVPKKYRGKKLNPSIEVGEDGYVTRAFDGPTQQWVSGPGDLLTQAPTDAYTPAELRNSSRRDFVNQLPDLPSELFGVVGSTPDKIPGEEVVALLDRTRDPSTGERVVVGRTDDPYIQGALNILHGVKGGARRVGPRTAVDADLRAARMVYDQAVRAIKGTADNPGPLTILQGMRKGRSLSMNPRISARLVPVTMREELGVVGDLDPAAKVDVTEDQLARAVQIAEDDLSVLRVEMKQAEKELREATKKWQRRGRERHKEAIENLEVALEQARLSQNEANVRELEEELGQLYDERRAMADTVPEDVEAAQAEVDELRPVVEAAEKKATDLTNAQLVLEKAKEIGVEEGADPEALDEKIARLEGELAKAEDTYRQSATEIEERAATAMEAFAAAGHHKDPLVREIEELAEQLGGFPEDAHELALLTYTQHLREFGLAYRLLEEDAKGRSLVKFLQKELSTEALQYVKVSYRNKRSAQTASVDEVVAALEGAESLPARSDIIAKFRRHAAKAADPSRLSERHIRSFMAEEDPAIARVIAKWLDTRHADAVEDTAALVNYARVLLDNIDPPRGENGLKKRGRFFNPNTQEISVLPFMTVLHNVRRRYLDAKRNKTVVTTEALDVVDDRGDADAREASLVEAWRQAFQDKDVNSVIDQQSETDLGDVNFFVTMLRAVEESASVRHGVNAIAEEMGIPDPHELSASDVLEATHLAMMRDPAIVDNLPTDIRHKVRSLYRVGFGAHSVAFSEELETNVDNARLYFVPFLRAAGLDPNEAFGKGLTPEQTYKVLEQLAMSPDAFPPNYAQILKAILKRYGPAFMPRVSFLKTPRSYLATWSGGYMEDSGTLLLNMTQPMSDPANVLLRGLTTHVTSLYSRDNWAGRTSEDARAMNKLAAKLQENFPEAGELTAGGAIRFAMTDPRAGVGLRKKSPSTLDRLVRFVTERVLGLQGDVALRRVRPVVLSSDGRFMPPGNSLTNKRAKTHGPRPTDPVSLMQDVAPAGVKVVASTSYSAPAWVSTAAPDTVFVNPEALSGMLTNLPPNARRLVADAIMKHEIVHLASLQELTDTDRLEILSAMTQKDMDEVNARVPEEAGGVEYAEEFIRMKVERAMFGADSDQFVNEVLSRGSGLRAQIVRALKRVLNKLMGLVKRKAPNPIVDTTIDRLRAAVAKIERNGLPLQPVPVADIDGHIAALEELVSEGTVERTFFQVPLASTDGAVTDKVKNLSRHKKMRREFKGVNNQVAWARNALQQEINDLRNHIRKAMAQNVRLTDNVINDALGSTDAYLSEQQQAQLDAIRQQMVADDVPEAEQQKRMDDFILNAQKERVLQRQAKQKAAMETLRRESPALHDVVGRFRENLTALSLMTGQVYDGGVMQTIFDSRAEVHLIRSFEFFNSPAWAKAAAGWQKGDPPVPGFEGVDFDKLRSDAIEEIKDWHRRTRDTEISGKEAYQRLVGWLNDLAKMPPEVVKVNTLTKTGTLFEGKDDIGPAARALLGEEGALTSAQNTATRLGMYLAKHEAAGKVRQILLQNGWATTEPNTATGQTEALWGQYANDSEYEALQGLYVRPEDVKVVEDSLASMMPVRRDGGNDFVDAAGSLAKKFFGLSLTLKTLFSLGFFTRNFGSNYFYFLPMQGAIGQFNPFSTARRGDLAWGGLGMKRVRAGNAEYINELLRNGVIHDDVTLGLMREVGFAHDPETIQSDLQEWADGGTPKPWIQQAWDRIAAAQGFNKLAPAAKLAKQPAAAVTHFLAKTNEMIDGVAKIHLYEVEKNTLTKAREESGQPWTDEEVQRMAADKVHRTLQGHSQVPAWVRSLTRSPIGMLVAPFARFKAEVFRVVFNTPGLILEEFKMGQEIGSSTLKRRALNRLAGFTLTNTAMTALLVQSFSALFDALTGDDREGEWAEVRGEKGRAVRSGLPKWQQHHSLWMRRNGDDTITTMDFTYYNPLSLITDPIKVFVDKLGTDGLDGAINATVSAVATDLIGEGIGPGALREVLTNSDEYNRDIYLETDDAPTRVGKMIAHYFDAALEPAIMSKSLQVLKGLDRKGRAVEGDRAYDALNIILGEVTGVRPIEYVESDLMKRSARNKKVQLDQIQRYLAPLNSPTFQSKEDIEKAVDQYVDAYTKLWSDHRRNAEAWTAWMDGDEEAVNKYSRAMKDAGHSRARIKQVMYNGVVDRPVRHRSSMENVFRAAETRGAEFGEVRVNNYIDAILRYPRFLWLGAE